MTTTGDVLGKMEVVPITFQEYVASVRRDPRRKQEREDLLKLFDSKTLEMIASGKTFVEVEDFLKPWKKRKSRA